MAILRLKRLKCIETNDYIGRDDVYITINGVEVQEPLRMGNGDVVSFGPRRSMVFKGEAELELWEVEPDRPDDHLGSHKVVVSESEGGETTITMDPARGKYELTYAVEPGDHGDD